MSWQCPAKTENYRSDFSQYHTQANPFPSQQELNNDWTKVSYKQRSTLDKTEREIKHIKESVHWLNQTSTTNHYTALLEEETEDQQHKAGSENTLKPPPVYIADVKTCHHSYSCSSKQQNSNLLNILVQAANKLKLEEKQIL
jgi:hypothetical protein